MFNKRVLIVDLDSQKNVSFLFGIDGNTIVAEGGCSMAHVLFKNLNPDKRRKSIRECIIKDVAPNVDIAYTSSELKDSGVHFGQEKINSHLLLSKALEVKEGIKAKQIQTEAEKHAKFEAEQRKKEEEARAETHQMLN